MTAWQRTDETVTVASRYVVTGVEPMGLNQRSSVRFVPDTVIIKIVDGKFRTPVVSGGRLLKNGSASALARYERLMWRDDDQPAWLAEIVADALANLPQ